MAKQIINVGATANDKKGDSLRAAFQKVNANFTELYTALGLNSDGTLNLGAFEFVGSTMSTTDSTAITIDQAVTVTSDLTVSGDILPSVANGGNLGSLDKPFKSLYVSDQTVFFGGVPLSLDADTNELKLNNIPISQTITFTDIPNAPTDIADLTDTQGLLTGGVPVDLTGYATESYVDQAVGAIVVPDVSNFITAEDIPAIPADISDLTDTQGLLGGGGNADTGDITFDATTISAPNEDEIVVQSKDSNGFGTARVTLNSEYGGDARLRAFSNESVDTFTLANGDFTTGVWQDNGFGNGVVSFTGAQGIGDFFQNTLFTLTSGNVSITINSEPAFIWNGGASGAGTDTPGFGTNPIVPATPVTITSIEFRYRSESFISVNYDNQEIRLNAQNAGIRMDSGNDFQVYGDSRIELQSTTGMSLSAGEDIDIGTSSSFAVRISAGDITLSAFDDVRIEGTDSFRLINSSATAPIRIITNDDDTSRTWAFNPNGTVTFPDNTVQTTAYTGPQTSLTGDVKGSVFADDSTLLVDAVSGSIPYGVLSGAPSFGNWSFNADTLSNSSAGDAVIQASDFAGAKLILKTRGETEKQWQFDQDGVLTLPAGGVIRETVVTENPTIELEPDGAEAASQKLIIKGGGPTFENTENGITVQVYNKLTFTQGETVYMGAVTSLAQGTTLYWWVDNYSPSIQFTPDNGELIVDEFGYVYFDFVINDDTVPFRVYVSDTLYDAYANNLGAVSVEINSGAVADGLHLHLTTGDLTETSIFLGTDSHNVRTKPNGAIELTSYNYEFEQEYRLTFKNNVLSIDSTDNPGDEDLYIKAGDDLYLDALGDDIHIRASDDVRIRTGVDFANDSTTWMYRFTDTGEVIFDNDSDGWIYGYIRAVNDGDGDRGLSVESLNSTRIKANDGNLVWTFDNDGNLSFPNGAGKINDSVSDGVGLQIEANLDFEIKVTDGEGGSTIWSFAGNDITFPDSTTQTTAFTGTGDITFNGDIISGTQGSVTFGDAQNTVAIVSDQIPVKVQINDALGDPDQVWLFGVDGSLAFPDATVQTTAWTGVAPRVESEDAVEIRVNLTDSTTHTWRFGEDGDLNIPGNISQRGSPGLTLGSSHNVYIVGDQGDNNRTWTFDGTSGDTALPNGTIIADDGSDGIEIVMPTTTAQANTFKWIFNDLAFGTSTLTLQAGTLYTNLSSWYFGFNDNGNGALKVDRDGQYINWFYSGEGGGKLIFGAPAGNNAGDANAIELKATDGDVYLTSTESVKITVDADDSSARVWTFDPTGVLSLPAGGDIVDSTGASVLGGGGSGSVLEEPFESKSSATGVIEHDATTNRLFRHTSISANFTANFTNLGLTAGKATSISLVLVQGATARMCTAVQIGGAAQTITWQGSASAPLGNANRTDVVTFSILCTATDTYTVLGMLTSFGG